MNTRKVAFFLAIAFVFSLFTIVFAAEKSKSERWYSVYFKGKKAGHAHSVFTDWEEGGSKFRSVKSKHFYRVSGTKGVYGAKGSREKKWSVESNSKYEMVLENGKVTLLKAKRTATRKPILRAKSKMEAGVLVIDRTEGVVDKTLQIKPEDYDVTSDPADMEPFLSTLTDKDVVKNILSLRDAEIKKTTCKFAGESKTKDVDGVEKAAKKYRLVDDEEEITLKTIDGRIVYSKIKDIKEDRTVVTYWTSKKKAKSDTGY